MRRLRDLSVGRRHAGAFGLMVLLLALVVAVALIGGASEASTKRALYGDQGATAAALQRKFLAADLNGRQTAYVFEAARPGAGTGVVDSSGARRSFLAAAAALRTRLAQVRVAHELDGYQPDVADLSRGDSACASTTAPWRCSGRGRRPPAAGRTRSCWGRN
jgi:hypothetical protein